MKRMMGSIAMVVLAVCCAAGGAGAESMPPKDDAQSRQISGVLKEVLHEQMKIKLKTDLDKMLVVDVPRPDLLTGLKAEDRIVIELDDRGGASKITKAAIPELPVPPAAGSGEGAAPAPSQ